MRIITVIIKGALVFAAGYAVGGLSVMGWATWTTAKAIG